MKTVLQLEQYFLTRLHVDWSFPSDAKEMRVAEVQSTFDYEVGTHAEDVRRRMLKLKAIFQELDERKQKFGQRIECEILGMFRFTEFTPEGKEELLLRINGFNLLYGALRGFLGSVTGCFPGGRFSLPSIMPQEIVEEIESRKGGVAPTKPDKTAAPAKTRAKHRRNPSI